MAQSGDGGFASYQSKTSNGEFDQIRPDRADADAAVLHGMNPPEQTP
jgi:hypothetical protein